MNSKGCGSASSRSGMALVVTLSILASLVIMALSYAVYMRTERMAAAHYSNATKARELSIAALDTVIASVINTNGIYPNWMYDTPPNTGIGICTGVIYGTTASGGTWLFLSTEISDILLPSQYDQPWRMITNNAGDFLGLYSYIIVNESDRLDINYAGSSPTNLGQRSAASNLVISGFQNVSNAAYLIGNRQTNYVRHYSQPDVRNSYSEMWGQNDAHFCSYSRYVQNRNIGNSNSPRILLSVPDSILKADQATIESALEDAGIPAGIFSKTFANLIDYVDSDFTPSLPALDYCGEAIPMINEIVVSNRIWITSDGLMYSNTASVRIELWYPFDGITNTNSYTIRIRGAFAGATPSTLNPGGGSLLILTNAIPGPWSSSSFKVATISCPDGSCPVSNATANVDSMRFICVVDLFHNAVPVDQAGQSTPSLSIAFGPGGFSPIPALGAPQGTPVQMGKSVNDPRINWRKTDWIQAPVTLGTTNDISVYNPGTDRPPLFVKNAIITNTGELGFIGLGDPTKPWRTIRLVAPNPERVYDVFTVHTNRLEYGLVNANSTDPEVMASSLVGTKTERFLNDPAASQTNSWNMATNIATQIVDSGPYSYISDIGNVFTSSATYSESQLEAIIRQSADMMDIRGNTFTVIMTVWAVQDRTSLTDVTPNKTWNNGIDPVIGKQSVVAQVWNDPLTKETQITFIKWIARN